MPVRRTLSSALFRSLEPRLREWLAAQSRETDAGGRIAGLEEQTARLEKKLSMAMGAIQAATAQIVQLRGELEQAANLSRQAMQKATTAQSTAESATEGITALEVRGPSDGAPAPTKPKPKPKPKPRSRAKRDSAG